MKKNEYLTIGGVDMTTNNPCPMQYASCIVARYDSGVSNYQKDRTGVLLKRIRKESKDEQYIQALISRQ